MQNNSNLDFMQEHTQGIREDFIYLTEEILKKDMKSANKQLQDTLMNYFLENQVGSLLKKPMNQTSKRAIRSMIEKELPEQGTKYINLLNAFEKNLKQYQVADEYIELLKDIIVTPNSHPRGQDNWKALVRKRILAVLLILHWYDKTKEYSDFFQLWDEVYPNDPLPKRKPKQKRKRKNNGDMIDKNERKQIKSDFQQKYEETDSVNEKNLRNNDMDNDDDDDDEDDYKGHVNIKQESNMSFPIDQLKQLNLQQNTLTYPNQQQQQQQQSQQNQQQQQVMMTNNTPFINMNMINQAQQNQFFQQQQQQNMQGRAPDDSNKFIFDQNTMYPLQNPATLNVASPMNTMSPIMMHHIQQQHIGAQSPYFSQGNSPNQQQQQMGTSPQNMMKGFANFTQSMNFVGDITPNEKDLSGLNMGSAFTPLNQQYIGSMGGYGAAAAGFGFQMQGMGINQMVNCEQGENKSIDNSPNKGQILSQQQLCQQYEKLNLKNNSTIPEQQMEETSSNELQSKNQQQAQQQNANQQQKSPQQQQQQQQQSQQQQQNTSGVNINLQQTGMNNDQSYFYNNMMATTGFTPTPNMQHYQQNGFPIFSPMTGNASNSNRQQQSQKKFQLNLQDASMGTFGEAVEQQQEQMNQNGVQQNGNKNLSQQQQNQQQGNRRNVILVSQNSGTPANLYTQGSLNFDQFSPQNSPGLCFQQNFNNGSPSQRNLQFQYQQQQQQQHFFKMGSNSRQGSMISEEAPSSAGIKKPLAQKRMNSQMKSQTSFTFETTPQNMFNMTQGQQYYDPQYMQGGSPQHNMFFPQQQWTQDTINGSSNGVQVTGEQENGTCSQQATQQQQQLQQQPNFKQEDSIVQNQIQQTQQNQDTKQQQQPIQQQQNIQSENGQQNLQNNNVQFNNGNVNVVYNNGNGAINLQQQKIPDQQLQEQQQQQQQVVVQQQQQQLVQQ